MPCNSNPHSLHARRCQASTSSCVMFDMRAKAPAGLATATRRAYTAATQRSHLGQTAPRTTSTRCVAQSPLALGWTQTNPPQTQVCTTSTRTTASASGRQRQQWTTRRVFCAHLEATRRCQQNRLTTVRACAVHWKLACSAGPCSAPLDIWE